MSLVDFDAENGDYSDYRNGKSLQQIIAHLYTSGADGPVKDVTFNVGTPPTILSAHKFILTISSSIFEAMLEPNVTVFDLPDTDADSFRQILAYIYTQELPEVGIMALEKRLELLKYANIFKIWPLARCAAVAIRQGISVDNVVEVLERATGLGDGASGKDLKERALDVICQLGTEFLRGSRILELSKEGLEAILGCDYLDVAEIEVYRAAVRWAEAQVRRQTRDNDTKVRGDLIRSTLGSALYLIRFLLISGKEFLKEVKPRGLLDDSELVELCTAFILGPGQEQSEEQEEQSEFLRLVSIPRRPKRDGSPGSGTARPETAPMPTSEGCQQRRSRKSSMNLRGEEPQDEGIKRMKLEIDPDETLQMEVENSPVVTPTLSTVSTELSFFPDVKVQPGPSSTPKAEEMGANGNLDQSFKTAPLLTEQQLNYIRQNEDGDEANNLTNMHAIMSLENDGFVDFCPEEPIVISPSCPVLPLVMPQLQDFVVKYVVKMDRAGEFKEWLAREDIATSVLFIKKAPTFTLRNLWQSAVNVDIKVNGLQVLKVDHKSQALVVSRIESASKEIIAGLNCNPLVRSLSLDSIQLTTGLSSLPFINLESLTLRSVTGINPRSFVASGKNMLLLSIDHFGGESFDFATLTPPRLVFLALGRASLTFSAKLAPSKRLALKELYLDECNFGADLNFWGFPKLKKLLMTGGVNLGVVLRMMEKECCPNLEWVAIQGLEFAESGMILKGGDDHKKGKNSTISLNYAQDKDKMIKILTDASLGDDKQWLTTKPKSFILEKIKGQQGQWKGRKVEGNEFERLKYASFGWGQFYADYSLFKKMNN